LPRISLPRIIQTLADLEEGLAELCARDPRLAAVYALTGVPPLRRTSGGFEALASIVVAQQVSVASAQAIWTRTRTILDPLSPETVAVAPDEDFRRAGLSMPKIRTLRAMAAAVRDGFDLDRLAELDADAAHAALTRIPGVGPWTADIYLLTGLGHADAFAAGDLAIREAARLALDLPVRPAAAELLSLAEAWRPWRAVAARLLWAYYRVAKSGRDGAPMLTGGRP
jgi:DNA-3-methyladenine glycosylase II